MGIKAVSQLHMKSALLNRLFPKNLPGNLQESKELEQPSGQDMVPFAQTSLIPSQNTEKGGKHNSVIPKQRNQSMKSLNDLLKVHHKAYSWL